MVNKYDGIELSPEQIQAREYQRHLGGGIAGWDKRGEFQVHLLRSFGLEPGHTLLDIGCGPLRAGVHFIPFLAPGHYCGVDYNASFIKAAAGLLAEPALAGRDARVSLLKDFDFGTLGQTFDFLLCFSVLNHCDERDRQRFFERVPQVMHAGSRLFITHGGWLAKAPTPTGRLALRRTWAEESELAPHLRLTDWGFESVGDRLPILEFGLGADGATPDR